VEIKILGTESLGVRGLSCMVCTPTRRILIDPGIALGYMRHGLLPHPFQIARGIAIKNEIIHHLHRATDVIFSHFHGDHIPLLRANPFQLSLQDVSQRLAQLPIHAPDKQALPGVMLQRRMDLEAATGHALLPAPEQGDDQVAFSSPVFHGPRDSKQGTVIMTRISDKETTFVHASDIQLLDRTAVERILTWHPDIVLVSGPPLYLKRLSQADEDTAWMNAIDLAHGVGTLILDHHLLRSRAGISWLDRLRQTTGRNVLCAADFMHTGRCFLEAWRETLYKEMPVPKGWHEAYARGEIDTAGYRQWREWDIDDVGMQRSISKPKRL